MNEAKQKEKNLMLLDEVADLQIQLSRASAENEVLRQELTVQKKEVAKLVTYFEQLSRYAEITFQSTTWNTGFKMAQFARFLTRKKEEDFVQDRVAELAGEFRVWNEKALALRIRHEKLRSRPLVPPKKIKLANLFPEPIVEEDVTVSVVIPTLNAEKDFMNLLPMLTSQKGVKTLEIIIVDSGSTDKTVEMASEYGCTLVSITQEQFSHSYSRNLGIKKATGKYTLVMTQDALPPTRYWFYEMLKALREDNVVAVSCAEFPRNDVDLFYRISSWNHYKFLGVDKDDRFMTLPTLQDYVSLRKNSQLSDIACLIQTDLIKKYQYRNDYAEDLDLGMRLIDDGHTIAFLGLTKIIHSHNRSAYYHLKRAYVDSFTMEKLFPDFPKPSVDIEKLFPDILFTYKMLDAVLCKNMKKISFPCSVETVVEQFSNDVHEILSKDFSIHSQLQKNDYVDAEFWEFIQKISLSVNSQKKGKYDGMLIPALLGFMGGAADYINDTYELIDEDFIDEFITCIYKAFANRLGSQFACCNNRQLDGEFESLNSIFAELVRGV